MRLSITGPMLILISISAALGRDATRGAPPIGPAAAATQQNVLGMANAAGPQMGAWWSDRDAGLIGGIGGTLLGLCGALVGTLGGCGIARWLVLPLTVLLTLLGIASLVAGVIALSIGQPYAVFYPLLLAGILVPAVMGPMFFLMRCGYRQRELRKMAAMDAR
jgi:hypothetical protein